MPNAVSKSKLKIFLSHASEDKAFVRRLEAMLEAEGFTVWVDYDDIHSGDNFVQRIDQALAWCDALLLVWSQAARASRWVEIEWTNALSLRKVIIPCVLDQTPVPSLLDNISYASFRDFEAGHAQLLQALRPRPNQTEPPPAPESNIRDRRVDAAAPSSAEVGQRFDLLVQVRFPDSPLLGLEEWPSKRKPEHLEQTSESIALQFPFDPRTGKLTAAKLEVQIVAPDFEIAGSARQRVLVPPEAFSKCLAFLITPKQSGVCRINVEVYDIDQTYLGAIPLETSIGGAPAAQAFNVANLMLFVMVGQERITPSAKLGEGDGIISRPASSIPPPSQPAPATRAPEFPPQSSEHETRYELPRSKASGCFGRVAFGLGVLASLVTVLAFVFDLPEKFAWFTPASSTFFGEVRDVSGEGVEGALIEVRERIEAPIIGSGKTGPRGSFNFQIKARYEETVHVTVTLGDSLGFADFKINAGNQILTFKPFGRK